MTLDPILTEIRKVREAYSERFSGDVKAMLADLRKRQQEGGRKVVSLPPKRIQAAQQLASSPKDGLK